MNVVDQVPLKMGGTKKRRYNFGDALKMENWDLTKGPMTPSRPLSMRNLVTRRQFKATLATLICMHPGSPTILTFPANEKRGCPSVFNK